MCGESWAKDPGLTVRMIAGSVFYFYYTDQNCVVLYRPYVGTLLHQHGFLLLPVSHYITN